MAGVNDAAASTRSGRTAAGSGAGPATGATLQELRQDSRPADATLSHACAGVKPIVRRGDILDTARVKVDCDGGSSAHTAEAIICCSYSSPRRDGPKWQVAATQPGPPPRRSGRAQRYQRVHARSTSRGQ